MFNYDTPCFISQNKETQKFQEFFWEIYICGNYFIEHVKVCYFFSITSSTVKQNHKTHVVEIVHVLTWEMLIPEGILKLCITNKQTDANILNHWPISAKIYNMFIVIIHLPVAPCNGTWNCCIKCHKIYNLHKWFILVCSSFRVDFLWYFNLE